MAEFKIRDKETGEVFTIREKQSQTDQPKKAAPSFSQTVARSMPTPTQNLISSIVGPGMAQFVPGGENYATKQMVQMTNDLSSKLTSKIPNTPNKNIHLSSPSMGDVNANINPRSASNFLLSGLIDPRSLMMMGAEAPIAAKGVSKLGEEIVVNTSRPGKLIQSSNKLLKQAEELTTQILQPTTTDLADAISKGKQLPSIRRGAENIESAKSFDEVVGHLRNTTKELFEERNMILKDYNAPIGDKQLVNLSNFADQVAKDKVMSPGKLKQIDNVFYRELEYLDQNPNMDIVTAQARKEKLQELTKSLLDKRRTGNLTGAENAELQAYDSLRAGYKKAILESLPKNKAAIVDKINSKYEGLSEATELASMQSAKSIKEVPRSFLEKIASSFGLSPKFTAFRLATKELAGLTGKTRLERTTSKIAELNQKSDMLRQLAKLAMRAQKK